MPIQLNKDAISEEFSEAAPSYDQWSQAQRLIAEALLEVLPMRTPQLVADLGCGTGLLTAMLAECWHDSEFHGYDLAAGMVKHCQDDFQEKRFSFFQADVESHRYSKKYDAVVSSCALQWLDNKYDGFENVWKAVNDSGYLAIAMPVAGSLSELSNAYQQTFDKPFQGLDYKDEKYYKKLFKKLGMDIKICEVRTITAEYNSAVEALHSFKGVGATFHHQVNYKPLSICEVRKLARNYEKLFKLKNGKIPLSYSILLLIAEKKS